MSGLSLALKRGVLTDNKDRLETHLFHLVSWINNPEALRPASSSEDSQVEHLFFAKEMDHPKSTKKLMIIVFQNGGFNTWVVNCLLESDPSKEA